MNDNANQTNRATDTDATNMQAADSETAVDSQGTDQEQGREILKSIRDKAFEGSDEKFAVALGRPTAEVTALMSGDEKVDDDVVMKARGIAQQRGVEVE